MCDWVKKFFFTTPHFTFVVRKYFVNCTKNYTFVNNVNSLFLERTFHIYCVLHHTLNVYISLFSPLLTKPNVCFISFGSFVYRFNLVKFSEFFKLINLPSLVFLKTLVFLKFFRDFLFYTAPLNKFYFQIQKFESTLYMLIFLFLKKKIFFIFMSNSSDLCV